MKPLRVFYMIVVTLSLATAFFFYWQYHLQNRELAQYRSLSQLAAEALEEVSAKLGQSKKELDESLQEIEQLNKTIAALEKEKSSFKGELQALKEEREKLKIKIAKLSDEKSIWEEKFLFLEKEFRSLEELRKAIRIVQMEGRKRRKNEIIQRRLAKIAMLKALDEIALREGNRGYLIRNTKTTLRPTRIKVELERASSEPTK